MAFGGQQSRRRAEWTLRMGRALSMCPAHHRCSEPPGGDQDTQVELHLQKNRNRHLQKGAEELLENAREGNIQMDRSGPKGTSH